MDSSDCGMAPTIKWQRWESAAYDWAGTNASDALPSLEAELDAWITTVNANASNSGRQLTKERGYANSTTSNYHGLVISAGANSNTSKGYMAYGTYGSATTKKIYLGGTFVDDTSNGGYGTISGGPSDTSISWYTSGQAADWLITYGVVDGEEYFNFGPKLGTSTSYMDGFTIMKCTDGEWSLFSGDSSVRRHIHYWDDAVSTGWAGGSRTSSGTTVAVESGAYDIARFVLQSLSLATTSFIGTSSVVAASPDMLQPVDTGKRTGDRTLLTDLGDGDNVYILTAYYQGPSVLVDLRP